MSTTTGSNAGTITMYADQQAIGNIAYFLPAGAELASVTTTVDNPALVSVTLGTLTPGTATEQENDDQPVTIQGLGTPGTTIVHFVADGVDNTDLTIELTARPVETVQVNAATFTIQNTPAS